MKHIRPLPLVASIALLLGGADATLAKAPSAQLNVLTTVRTTPRAKLDAAGKPVSLNGIGNLTAGGAAFIVTHDSATQRIFITNAIRNTVDVVDISDPSMLDIPPSAFVRELTPGTPEQPTPYTQLALGTYGSMPLSVTTRNGLVAISMAGATKTQPGKVVFFDSNLQFIRAVDVGAYPDMLTFTPDGRYILVANEGEPSTYAVAATPTKPAVAADDPEGSISVIDMSNGVANLTVRTADFRAFNGREAELNSRGIRIYGPGADAAHDLEPEYIAVSHDSKYAWVTLQEANALAIVDIRNARVQEIAPLGEKDHAAVDKRGQPINGLDPSNTDGGPTDVSPADGSPDGIKIRPWPVHGLYQSDAIASFKVRKNDFLILANEGDSRNWPGLNEESTVSGLTLDPSAFLGWDVTELKKPANLGSLIVSNISGWKDVNGTKVYSRLYSLGGRSFSIRDARGALVWDSGDAIERITAAAAPLGFNTSHDRNDFERRSPSKGPEPEAVAVGSAFGRTYAFIGLERVGGIIVYDVSDPYRPSFEQYINQRDFSKDVKLAESGDLGPEGMVFIDEDRSPNGKPLLIVAHELSGTTTIFELKRNRSR